MQKGDFRGTRLFKQKGKESVLYETLFEQFYKSAEIKGRAVDTLRTYRHHNKYFLEFLCYKTGKNNPTCEIIDFELMEDYISYLQQIKEIKNNITINSYMQNVSPVIKYGFKKGYIYKDFQFPYLKVQETFKEIYTPEEIEVLLEKPKKSNFVEIRDWAIIWTLASTAIRATELRNLIVQSVDLINRSIAVNRTKSKKPRYVPISTSLCEVLEEYLEVREGEGEGYLFPTVFNTQMERSTLQKQIKRYCNERGIEKCSLHLFRHTFITNSVNANVSPLILKRVTGHSTLHELNKYYNARLTDVVAIIDDVAPKINKKQQYFKNKK
ncbi:tyrosine-type recombinase/integrase [Clostridium manihotivorum]|uniref:Recombinase n=1 Tax=Clostridium manihotivorum TaxID=2320868 RepID=A0A3R5U7V5_9CLOT|nr:site-specific integrase [Clostridium manihotivorum]QAA31173.1 recombinase [Clostridium manihotivorum]